ncbi:MAG: hypothetical protein AABX02_03625 [archaeon]
MPSIRLLFLSVGICILVSIVLGFWISSSTPSVIGEGNLSQSPLTYLFFVVFLLAIGFIFSRMYNRASSDGRFSFAGFLNVGFAGIVMGGIVHELVHMILLRHPTQFQVHFGDPVAIFSTCCLAAGELPQEEIAYGIQFVVMVLWFYFNRSLIFHHETPAPEKTESVEKKKRGKSIHAPEQTASKETEPTTEHSIEKEWEKSRSEINDAFARLEKEGKT